jgi:predicted membrane metal-binding protein
MWNYLYLVVHLNLMDKTRMNGVESYLWQKISSSSKVDTSWFPLHKVVVCALRRCGVPCQATMVNYSLRRAAPWSHCCAVLCCAVLCCAVLCCAVLCCAVLCCFGELRLLLALCSAVWCCSYLAFVRSSHILLLCRIPRQERLETVLAVVCSGASADSRGRRRQRAGYNCNPARWAAW